MEADWADGDLNPQPLDLESNVECLDHCIAKHQPVVIIAWVGATICGYIES